MTKTPKSMDSNSNNHHHHHNMKEESDNLGIVAVNSRESNYKSQKPILEKRRRDRINGSLDELKNLLLAIKQRDPLRYARLEKADILEMVVKHLKDLKKRRQAMIAAMEPILFRSYKMGYLDCTRATIDFLNEIETPADRKKEIIEHISSEAMKTLQNQCPTTNFTQHHEIVFANVNPPEHFMPFSLLAANDMEWPSLEERLGFSPIGKSNFLLPEMSNVKDHKTIPPSLSSSSLLKIAERQSAFVAINKSSSSCIVETNLESPSTSGTSMTFCNDETMPQQSIYTSDNDHDDGDEDDDEKLIIDDHNNNQTAWRPWL